MPGLQTAFAEGLAANRPAASSANAGYFYYATDSGILAQSTGSAWVAVGFSNPMTTQDDLIVAGAAGAPARLAKGTDGQVLTVDPTTHHLLWATPAAGFSDPTTTKGDLIVHGSSTTRLGVGTDTQVLTADSTQTLGVKWAAAGTASLSTASAFLSGNFTLTSANTYYDVLSLSLAAGTWAVWGGLTYSNGTNGNNLLARVWDGTTATSALQTTNAGAGYQMSTTIMAILTPGSTTSYKLSAACQTSAGTLILATPSVLATGLTNLASWFYGIKIA